MKKLIPIIILLFVISLACSTKKNGNTVTQDKVKEPEKKEAEVKKVEDPIEKLGKEMKEIAKAGVEPTQEKLDEINKAVSAMFPKTENDLNGYTWDISTSKNKDDKDIFIAADLNRKNGDKTEKAMWFHILYNPNLTKEERDNYGTYNFEGYKGTLNENAHLWILVNNTEIRAIAESEDFKNTQKLIDVLKKFNLKDIEKL